MKEDDPRVGELTAALHKVEQKLAEREALIATVLAQTEAARLQYEQANERAETLRRRLDAKEEELQQRDERIAMLEQQCAENDDTLHAINQDVKHQNSANPNARLAAMGLVLESLDERGVNHRINRVTTTLGRASGNDIAINSNSVSRYHSRIVVAADGVYLIDLQSTNGSSVNGQRISRRLIGDSDIISIGNARYRLATGVPLGEFEDRSMDETHALLNHEEIFSPAPKSKPKSTTDHLDKPKGK